MTHKWETPCAAGTTTVTTISEWNWKLYASNQWGLVHHLGRRQQVGDDADFDQGTGVYPPARENNDTLLRKCTWCHKVDKGHPKVRPERLDNELISILNRQYTYFWFFLNLIFNYISFSFLKSIFFRTSHCFSNALSVGCWQTGWSAKWSSVSSLSTLLCLSSGSGSAWTWRWRWWWALRTEAEGRARNRFATSSRHCLADMWATISVPLRCSVIGWTR